MDNAHENMLWESAGVRSVAELREFPFHSYRDFTSAVKSGEARIGIEYAAARELSHITKSLYASYLILALALFPAFLAIVSVVLALITHQWLILTGILAAIFGMAMASPHNPLRRLALGASLIALGYCIFKGTIINPGAWSGFVFAVSFLAVSNANRTAWNWAHAAVLSSEALTAYLWRDGQLHINTGNHIGAPINKADASLT